MKKELSKISLKSLALLVTMSIIPPAFATPAKAEINNFFCDAAVSVCKGLKKKSPWQVKTACILLTGLCLESDNPHQSPESTRQKSTSDLDFNSNPSSNTTSEYNPSYSDDDGLGIDPYYSTDTDGDGKFDMSIDSSF